MFYSQFILAKKGPLGTIWIAAHLERKLRKNQVADTDIGVSVDSILFPDVPIALRLSSHLLLGVVRIYSRKVNYLFDDCSETLLKIKQAFRSTAVDLPPEESTAPYHSITLPETFDLDDFELPDNDIFQGNYVDHHVSSRDQITLQDTMDGVVYSTSQFGLDERFGDGDASGLDLDEDLFMNKVEAAGQDGVMLNSDADTQVSVKPTPSLKQAEYSEMTANSEIIATSDINQIKDDRDTDFYEYAQDPCTPGFMEEPNLSNLEENSTCADHPESENQIITDFAVKDNLENASSKSDLHIENKNVVVLSLHSDVSPDTLHKMSTKENGFLTSDLESYQTEPQGEASPTAVTMEQMPSVNHDSPLIMLSALEDQVKAISPIPNFSDRPFAASDIPDTVGDLQKGIVINKETCIVSDDKTQEDCEEQGARSSESTVAISSLNSICQPLSEYVSNNQAPLKAESSHNMVFEEPKNAKISNLSVHEKMVCTDTHVLRPCVSQLNQLGTLNSGGEKFVDRDIPTEVAGLENSEREEENCALGASSGVQGDGCHGNDDSKKIVEENHITESASCEDKQDAVCKLNDQVENAISGDTQLEMLNGYKGSDLPAPEKLLSVPEGHADVPTNFLVEATPDQVLATTAGNVAADKIVSGKKRSFTEIAVTMLSFNSADSSGIVRTKKSPESIPDDDDLLSSILVGRKSSVLKVKATPQLEITSLKRPRLAPRSSASKRKVLMDDTMVLHGDTIRQQLTNTVDIRRIRKKAPCSRPEISMLQKQFLEDEIFSEIILTGVSMVLASLHNQSYDLSEIRVSKNDVNDASFGVARSLRSISNYNDEISTHFEAANDKDISIGPNSTNEIGIEGTSDLMEVGDNGEVQPVKTPMPTESWQCEDHSTNLDPTSNVAEVKSSKHEFFGETTEMDIDGNTISEVDVVNPDSTVGVDASEKSSGGIQLASSNNISESDASLQINAPGLSADQQFDMFSVETDAKEDAEKEHEDIAAVGTESSTIDEVVLREMEGAASVEIGADIQTNCLAHSDSLYPSTMFSSEAGGCSSNVVINDKAMEEVWKNKQAVVKGDSVLDAEVEYDAKTSVINGVCGEELVTDTSDLPEFNVRLRNEFLDDGEISFRQEASDLNIMDAGISSIDRDDHDDFNYSTVGHDTDFLNVDDDDIAEADDESMPNAEETRFVENSGWSSRTRAVAKYLQTLFDNEAERGKKVLPIDDLLAGKTRKEASRMFFETLVLKTKDYIHVEQETPFNNIYILPRAKLTKSDF